MNLLKRLIELQETADNGSRMSDEKFAQLLGVSHQLWWMTRQGKREVHLTLLEGVCRNLPEFYGDVLEFLQGRPLEPGEDIIIRGPKVE